MKPAPMIRNAYSKCAFKIHTFYQDNLRGTATGFFYEYSNQLYIVTNWHVVTGRDFLSGRILDSSGMIEACPTALELNLIETIPHEEQPLVALRNSQFRMELYTGGEPIWFEYPGDDSICDVVAIGVTPESLERFFHLPINRMDEEPIPWRPGDTVFILGYPIGIGASGGFPIWKSGYVASEPEFPISLATESEDGSSNETRLSAFYIDSATREGMSGGPVIAKISGLWDGEDPFGSHDLRDQTVIGTGTEFVGCYSGRVQTSALEAGLGICWRRDVLDQICATRIRGRNPHIY